MIGNLKSNLVLSLLLIGVNLAFFNLIFNRTSALRVDMTEGDIYSLSPVTERYIANLDEEVRIKAYFSRPENVEERIRPFIPEIRDLLNEYAARSNGKIRLEWIVPEEASAEEEEAQAEYGVEPNAYAYSDQRQQGVRSFYFAIVVEYASAQAVKIGFRDMVKDSTSMYDKEQRIEMKNVEFAITRAIKKSQFGFEGQKDIFAKFDHKAALTTFLSPADELPETFKKVPEHAQKVFSEMAKNSLGKVEYRAVEPPKTEAEQRDFADRLGIVPISLPMQEKAFYLWATLEIDGKLMQPIPLLAQEGSLGEHELRSAFEGIFKRQSKGYLRTVGIVQATPDFNPMAMQMGRPPEPAPFDGMREYLAEEFEVRSLDSKSLTDVPNEVDVLMVMGPRDLSEKAQYAIDQYIMRGGKVILCADRTDVPTLTPEFGLLNAESKKTGLEDMLASWGVTIEDSVVMDKTCGQFFWAARKAGRAGRQPPLHDFAWPALPMIEPTGETVNGTEAPFLEGLSPARFWFASPISLRKEPVEGLKSTWLLRSTKESWLKPAGPVSPDITAFPKFGYPEPGADEKKPGVNLAVLVQGTFKSAFADKAIPATNAAGDEPATAESQPTSQPARKATATLKKSPPTRVVVFGNSDWVDYVQYGWWQGGLPRPYGWFGPNAEVLKSTITWLLEDEDLISIRGRGRSFRPIQRLEPSTVSRIQWANFALPLLLVGALGTFVFMTRANRKAAV